MGEEDQSGEFHQTGANQAGSGQGNGNSAGGNGSQSGGWDINSSESPFANQNRGPQNGGPQGSQDLSILSVIGLILSIISTVPGLIVSILAYYEASRTGDARSKRFAKAGIIVAVVKLVLVMAAYVLLFAWGFMAAGPY